MRWIDSISLQFATGLGVGLLPGPTGTYGSILGLALFYWVAPHLDAWVTAVLAIPLFVVAVAASARAVARFHDDDPRQVVCDEICGQWISLLFVPIAWKPLLAGFVLFRVFDIIKPFPARRFEDLPGGWGVVADDVMAGIYANLVLQLLLYFL